MKKFVNFVHTSVAIAVISGGFAFFTAISQSATVSAFDPVVTNDKDLWPQTGVPTSEAVVVSEAIVCKGKRDAEAIAAAFNEYGTAEQFSVAYEAYRKHEIECKQQKNYWLPVFALDQTMLAEHQHSNAFVVNHTSLNITSDTAVIDYVVVTRPDVFEAVFRTCDIERKIAGRKKDGLKTNLCWRDL